MKNIPSKNHRILWAFLIFIALSNKGYAQFTPCFTAEYTSACFPMRIQMIDCSGADPSLIFYDFGSGPQANNFFEYTTAGTYSVTQIINSGSGGASVEKKDYIHIYPTQPFDVTPKACPNFGIVIELPSVYPQYQITWGDGAVEVFDNLAVATHSYTSGSLKSIKIRGIYTDGALNCFEWTGSFQPIDQIPRPTVYSIETTNVGVKITFEPSSAYTCSISYLNGAVWETLTTVSEGQGSIFLPMVVPEDGLSFRLSYAGACGGSSSYNEIRTASLSISENTDGVHLGLTHFYEADFAYVQLYKQGQPSFYSENRSTAFVDESLSCGVKYNFQWVVVYQDSSRSISQKEEIIPGNRRIPPTPKPVNASVEAYVYVQLTWDLPLASEDVFSQQIYREAEGEIKKIAELSADVRTYTDTKAIANEVVYTYYIGYQDVCGNFSPHSEGASPMMFEGQFVDNRYLLQCTQYVGFVRSRYELWMVTKDGEPIEILEDNFRLTYVQLPVQEQRFYLRVKAINETNSAEEVWSNVYVLQFPSSYVVPTAFSPNADGLNETWGSISSYIEKEQLYVWNQEGVCVFNSEEEGKSRWDGTYRGEAVKAGIYLYKATGVDFLGKTWESQGYLWVKP